MEHQEDQESDYSDVVNTLLSMFGNVVQRDVISAVVENCDGDLNLAAEAVMNISSYIGNNIEQSAIDDTNTTEPVESVNNTYNSNLASETNTHATSSIAQAPHVNSARSVQPTMSYSNAFRNTGAVPKKQTQKQSRPNEKSTKLNVNMTIQLRNILTYHNQGYRILIIMRGAPGSGKSYLAKQIIEMTIGPTHENNKNHICSSDDYFIVRGMYRYVRERIGDAHSWNQRRVRAALKQGRSPMIVDNTNIELWEMQPYMHDGVHNGYIIEVVEPNTSWAKDPKNLVKRSIHNVPIDKIARMLDNYQTFHGEDMLFYYKLSYPANMVPPVLRKIPPIVNQPKEESETTLVQLDPVQSVSVPTNEPSKHQASLLSPKIQSTSLYAESATGEMDNATIVTNSEISNVTTEIINCFPIDANAECQPQNDNTELNEFSTQIQTEGNLQQNYMRIQNQLLEIEKVNEEWEKGESWVEESQETVRAVSPFEKQLTFDPKPPRFEISEESSPRRKLIDTDQKYEDWTNLPAYMSLWNKENTSQSNQTPDDSKETNPINTQIHDIEKITEMLKSDRVSDTANEKSLPVSQRCKNEEKHFIAFRKLFKNLPRAALRDVFDNCCGDVNWAVDIILGGMANNQLEIGGNEVMSDTEEESQEQCDCFLSYNAVPDLTQTSTQTNTTEQNVTKNLASPSLLIPKKHKHSPSENSVNIKRQIEKNIVISENHYPDHCLKIMKQRRGDYHKIQSDDSKVEESSFEVIENPMQCENQECPPSTSHDAFSSSYNMESDDEESIASSLECTERTVNVILGTEFVKQLDDLFGRKDMTYPDNIVPKISIPVTLLNELNAFWLESLMHQLDEQDKQSTRMINEDAEFARQLAMKEEEMAQQGKEPEVPDLKEIMDMDLALSLYQKDVDEWRNKEPNDIAAKLTRDKLYNLFPDMSPDILSELLMAHDNNFQATVEVLLMSTGKSDILQEKNGVNKFVMEKEMERKRELLKEEKKALSEVEWPFLPATGNVEMSVVSAYREEADMHLERRNLSYVKAQESIQRGMTEVALYYSELAAFHKNRYEQANSLAAASLVQFHAANSKDNATIDLHYLRVGEARESLDLFLDTHIQKLKETQHNGRRPQRLFFITGRGKHSNTKPRIKPAVKNRLRQRGLSFYESNPGMISACVTADDKLTYQIQTP